MKDSNKGDHMRSHEEKDYHETAYRRGKHI